MLCNIQKSRFDIVFCNVQQFYTNFLIIHTSWDQVGTKTLYLIVAFLQNKYINESEKIFVLFPLEKTQEFTKIVTTQWKKVITLLECFIITKQRYPV